MHPSFRLPGFTLTILSIWHRLPLIAVNLAKLSGIA